MPRIDYLLFLEQSERHLSYIAKAKADLQEYAARPDAKETYIEKRNLEIAIFYSFYQNALDAVEILMSDNSSEYSRGKSDGYLQKTKEIEQIPQKYFDKEAARAHSIEKALKELPHLY